MNKDEIMKQFDEAIKNLKEWVEEPKECKHEWYDKLHDGHYYCRKCNKYKDEQPEPKPEWEEKLSRVFDTMSPLPLEPMSERVLREQHNIKVIWLKGFIRQEFKQLALDFKRELLPERYYPDVKQHTRNQMWIDNAILEALHKRGVI